MIRERLKVATDKQKSYVNLKRKDIRYEIGEKVFLKVSPWKKVLRFGKKGKLSPRFIKLYEVIEKVGLVAYRLALPPELEKIHYVFHVSMLRRYRSDLSHPYPHLGKERGRNTGLKLFNLLLGHWWAHLIYKSIRK